jgi:hypothetical protein
MVHQVSDDVLSSFGTVEGPYEPQEFSLDPPSLNSQLDYNDLNSFFMGTMPTVSQIINEPNISDQVRFITFSPAIVLTPIRT